MDLTFPGLVLIASGALGDARRGIKLEHRNAFWKIV